MQKKGKKGMQSRERQKPQHSRRAKWKVQMKIIASTGLRATVPVYIVQSRGVAGWFQVVRLFLMDKDFQLGSRFFGSITATKLHNTGIIRLELCATINYEKKSNEWAIELIASETKKKHLLEPAEINFDRILRPPNIYHETRDLASLNTRES